MSFAYSVSINDQLGLGASEDNLIAAVASAALADWSQYITGQGTVTWQITLADTGSNGLLSEDLALTAPSEDVSVSQANGVTLFEPAAVYELDTGQHLPGTNADIDTTLNMSYLSQFWMNTTGNLAVPANLIDLRSVLLHELGHGFAMSGFYDDNVLSGSDESLYDQYVQVASDGTASFSGPYARAVYGSDVPLFSGPLQYTDEYELGAPAGTAAANDLMNYSIGYGEGRDISNLDLAILKDSGVPVTSWVDGDAPSVPTSNYLVWDADTASWTQQAGSYYTGPAPLLQTQFIGDPTQGTIVQAEGPNAYISTGSGSDSITVISGDNVVDAGAGNNFLQSGTGMDLFFADIGGAQQDWNEVLNFHTGDWFSLRGYVDGQSSYAWSGQLGAAGYLGATLIAHTPGASGDASAAVTFVGFSNAQAQQLHVSSSNGFLILSF